MNERLNNSAKSNIFMDISHRDEKNEQPIDSAKIVLTESIKASAFEYMTMKDKLDTLSVDGEKAIFEFVEYLCESIKGI